MNTFAKLATAAAVAGALAVPMATPSYAAWSHRDYHHDWRGDHWRGDRGVGAAIGFGAGALLGAAAANSYGPGYGYNGYNDYAYAQPGYDSYAYASGGGSYAYGPGRTYPYAYGTVNNSNVNEHLCMLSPGSPNYEPCLNRP